MKKILVLCLTAFLCLSLLGCKKKGNTDDKGGNKDQETVTEFQTFTYENVNFSVPKDQEFEVIDPDGHLYRIAGNDFLIFCDKITKEEMEKSGVTIEDIVQKYLAGKDVKTFNEFTGFLREDEEGKFVYLDVLVIDPKDTLWEINLGCLKDQQERVYKLMEEAVYRITFSK